MISDPFHIIVQYLNTQELLILCKTSEEIRDICFNNIYLLNLHDRYLDMIRSGRITQMDLEFMFRFQHPQHNMQWQWTKFLNQCLREITDQELFDRCISLRDIDLTYHIAPGVVTECPYPLASHLINTYPGVYITFDTTNSLLATRSQACVDIYNLYSQKRLEDHSFTGKDLLIESMFECLSFTYWMENFNRIQDSNQWCQDCMRYGDDSSRFIACSLILRDELQIAFTPRTMLELEIYHHLSPEGFNYPALFKDLTHMNRSIRKMSKGSFPEDVTFCYKTNSYSSHDYYLIEHKIIPFLDVSELEFYLRRNYCDDIYGSWRSLRCITRVIHESTLHILSMTQGCRLCLSLISVIDSKLGRIYHCNEM